jgi:hypothetical protein
MNLFYAPGLLSETSQCELASSVRRTRHIGKYVAERYAICRPQLIVEAEAGV